MNPATRAHGATVGFLGSRAGAERPEPTASAALQALMGLLVSGARVERMGHRVLADLRALADPPDLPAPEESADPLDLSVQLALPPR